jgi:hypothetical protein
MSVSSPHTASRPHPRGLPTAIVSVLVGAAAIAGLLLGNSFGNGGSAGAAGESDADGLLLVLLLVAAGLSFVAGAMVGLRLQRRARTVPSGADRRAGADRGGTQAPGGARPRAGARAPDAADVRDAAGARLELVAEAERIAAAKPVHEAEPARKPGSAPARSRDKRPASAAPGNNGTLGSAAPPTRD